MEHIRRLGRFTEAQARFFVAEACGGKVNVGKRGKTLGKRGKNLRIFENKLKIYPRKVGKNEDFLN